jgi:hypothetical protein
VKSISIRLPPSLLGEFFSPLILNEVHGSLGDLSNRNLFSAVCVFDGSRADVASRMDSAGYVIWRH